MNFAGYRAYDVNFDESLLKLKLGSDDFSMFFQFYSSNESVETWGKTELYELKL